MSYDNDNRLTFFARTNFRDMKKPVGIRRADRLHHIYIIGKTGTGKSTMMETMMLQDLWHGEGFALLDPHGDLVERVRDAVPASRRSQLIYFDVPDASRPLGFNPLAGVPPTDRPLAASNVLETFKKIWADSWGPRLEHILRNALLALLDQPEPTLGDILRLLDEKDFRTRAVDRVSNRQVRRFWLKEYASWPARLRADAISPVQNKVGAFLSNPILNAILTQKKSAFDVRQVMDTGKILLVNLAKGRIGEDAAALLGSLLVSKIGMAALARADQAPASRRNFYLYLDEFHGFTTLSLANMLSELRKYGIGLVLAHQYLSQLDPQVREAVLGNVGTMLVFRVGAEDVQRLHTELCNAVQPTDLLELPNRHLYMKTLYDGQNVSSFSASSLALPPLPSAGDPYGWISAKRFS